jgi:hypothetical protein
VRSGSKTWGWDERQAQYMSYPHDAGAPPDELMGRRWFDDDREIRKRHTKSVTPDQEDADDEVDESQWDDAVDLICVGHGSLATAITVATRQAGLDVMLAGSPATGTPEKLLDVSDEETTTYLRALTEDFTALPADPEVLTRVVGEPVEKKPPRDRLATFHGAALRDWGMACVASPYGLLYTRVAHRPLWSTYAGADGAVEAMLVGTAEIDPGQRAASVRRWLAEIERDGEAGSSGALQRLAFDNGMVAGAAVDAEGGTRLVRARRGIMLCLGDGNSEQPGELDLRETAQVALVSRAASRFARLELLARN